MIILQIKIALWFGVALWENTLLFFLLYTFLFQIDELGSLVVDFGKYWCTVTFSYFPYLCTYLSLILFDCGVEFTVTVAQEGSQ